MISAKISALTGTGLMAAGAAGSGITWFAHPMNWIEGPTGALTLIISITVAAAGYQIHRSRLKEEKRHNLAMEEIARQDLED